MNRLQFISLLAPALGSVVLGILGWINAHVRTARLEAGQDQTRADIEIARSELRIEIVQLRGKVAGLCDMVYREMVSPHERVAAVEAKHT